MQSLYIKDSCLVKTIVNEMGTDPKQRFQSTGGKARGSISKAKITGNLDETKDEAEVSASNFEVVFSLQKLIHVPDR